MAATLVVMVILIGVMNFQYYCALAAHKADVRACATRLGLLLLEGWKTQLGDVLTYDPRADFSFIFSPAEFSAAISPIPGNPPILGGGTAFRYYTIMVDGVRYFVKLSYEDDDPAAPRRLRTLNVAVAWSRDFGSATLEYDRRREVRLTKYANWLSG
jgi:hypothetical protein